MLKDYACQKRMGNTSQVTSFPFIFVIVVNKNEFFSVVNLQKPCCLYILEAYHPATPCLSLKLTLVHNGRGICIMPEAQVLFGSVQIWPLSFQTIVSSLAYLSRPLQSRCTSTHIDSDQYSFQTLVWLSLP